MATPWFESATVNTLGGLIGGVEEAEERRVTAEALRRS